MNDVPVSDPVYRIDVEHRPMDVCEWYARATRLSDDSYMSGGGFYGDSAEEALQKVRDWIAAEQTRQDGFSIFTDEYGNMVPELHSVKS